MGIEGGAMKEKIIEICKKADTTVDYTATNLVTGGLIDSVTLVEIVSEIMEQFEIEIPYDMITPNNFDSINKMVELVEKYV